MQAPQQQSDAARQIKKNHPAHGSSYILTAADRFSCRLLASACRHSILGCSRAAERTTAKTNSDIGSIQSSGERQDYRRVSVDMMGCGGEMTLSPLPLPGKR